jgi:hypothetical protein
MVPTTPNKAVYSGEKHKIKGYFRMFEKCNSKLDLPTKSGEKTVAKHRVR